MPIYRGEVPKALYEEFSVGKKGPTYSSVYAEDESLIHKIRNYGRTDLVTAVFAQMGFFKQLDDDDMVIYVKNKIDSPFSHTITLINNHNGCASISSETNEGDCIEIGRNVTHPMTVTETNLALEKIYNKGWCERPYAKKKQKKGR